MRKYASLPTLSDFGLSWTESQSGALLLGLVLGFVGFLGGLDVLSLRVSTVVLIGLEVLLALPWGAMGGLLVGLLTGASYVATHVMTGQWRSDNAAVLLVTLVAMIGCGWLCGSTGSRLRRRDLDRGREPAAAGAGGSQGMLDAQEVGAFLEAEFERAVSYDRPLAVLSVRAEFDPDLSEAARRRASRAVARAVANVPVPGMMPFLLADDRFGAVLPEHDGSRSLGVAASLMLEIENSTFSDRDSVEPVKLSDAVHVEIGQAVMTPTLDSAADLLAIANESPSLVIGETTPVALFKPVSGVAA